MPRRQFPLLFYNWITGIGAVLALVSFSTAVVFLVLSIFLAASGPYLGVLIYLVLPAITVFGLLLIPLGMWRKSRLLRKAGTAEGPPWPCIDFNVKTVRRGAIVFIGATVCYILASSVGTYQAYQYTESVQFCGTACHTVMEPQYVTHRISPHAIVACTTCHVGPGVGWYEKSKIRGLSRVREVVFSSYPKPIPTPIADLTPAELECHRCHWPNNFYGGRRRIFHHSIYDEKNTPWPVDLIVHVGGGDPGVDETGGIHWYMNIGYRVEYIARDRQRQDIPWVRATNRKTGKVTVYQSESNPLSKEEIAAASPRTMDCVDCHNSPAHIFRTPDQAIDMAMFLKQIDPRLPNVKQTAVSAMGAPYKSKEEAMAGIAQILREYYRDKHPAIAEKMGAEIEKAVQATQERFAENVFPYMKVDWKTYPDNVGHFYYKGCFRCHEGEHRSESGEKIPHDCTTCHRIVAQGSGLRAETEASSAGLKFEHPVNIGGLWEQMACSSCHTGVGVAAEAAARTALPVPAMLGPPAASGPKVEATLSAQERAEVRGSFQKLCLTCHAADGRPDSKMIVVMPRIPDFTDRKWQAAHNNAELHHAILDGKPPFMPAYKGKLGSISADQLVVYVRQFAQSQEKKPVETKLPRGSAPQQPK